MQQTQGLSSPKDALWSGDAATLGRLASPLGMHLRHRGWPEVPALVTQPSDLPHALFIYPGGSFDSSESRSNPPLSILTLAALAARHGWTVEVCDLRWQPLPTRRPDLVGISALTCDAPYGYAISSGYREQGVPTVMGGVHASLLPREALLFCDAVCVGEAESVIATILDDAAAGRMAGIYEGVWGDMSEAPGPQEYYGLIRSLPRGVYSTRAVYQTTRGCRFNCDFCSVIRINGRGQRRRSVEQVVDDFRFLSRGGRHMVTVNVVDDDLAADPEGTLELMEALARASLPVRWGAQASVGLADQQETLRLARDAGLYVVYAGLDSLTREGNIAVNKKNRPSRFQAVIETLHSHDIKVKAGVIMGIRGDTAEVLAEYPRIADSLNADSLSFSILTPFPGTKVFVNAVADGRIETFDWSLYTGMSVVMRPESISIDDLREAHFRALKLRLEKQLAVGEAPSEFAAHMGQSAKEAMLNLRQSAPDRWIGWTCQDSDLTATVEASDEPASLVLSKTVEIARRPQPV